MKHLTILLTCLLLSACADFHPYAHEPEPTRFVLEVEDPYRCLGPDFQSFRQDADMVCNEVARFHMVCACP